MSHEYLCYQQENRASIFIKVFWDLLDILHTVRSTNGIEQENTRPLEEKKSLQ